MLNASEETGPGEPGWRARRAEPPLSDVHRSIPIIGTVPWRRFVAFLGPGYLVAVGYMDPGNWATSLAGGSTYAYALLPVVVLSSLMAILLQSLAARLAFASGRDLAQACRDAYPPWVAKPLWLLAELAICATDLAEVIGTAIGLKLLFGIPLALGVLITAADVFLVLYLQSKGFRWVEAFVIALLAIIFGCFFGQIVLAQPDVAAVLEGLIPTTEIVTDQGMLYLALGIVGATVMPHNLYLHSGIVQTRAFDPSLEGRREAIRFATFDSAIALGFALIINASILILAAATFHARGQVEVESLENAHELLQPLVGSTAAPILFAVALLACGLSSTVTATLAGQIVMEGFLRLKLAPWLRRLVTRAVAIVPAVVVTVMFGEGATAKLLILSQVVLSLQLPFAVIPLVLFTADRQKLGALAAPRIVSIAAGLVALLIVALNLKLIADFLMGQA